LFVLDQQEQQRQHHQPQQQHGFVETMHQQAQQYTHQLLAFGIINLSSHPDHHADPTSPVERLSIKSLM
jgi:hypothetical protein